MPHDECVGPKAETVDGRVFDTMANQIARNGDAGKALIVKIDVEGAEWHSLLETPDALLERIDQLAMEMHGTGEPHFFEAVQKLKRTFIPFTSTSTIGRAGPNCAVSGAGLPSAVRQQTAGRRSALRRRAGCRRATSTRPTTRPDPTASCPHRNEDCACAACFLCLGRRACGVSIAAAD